MSIFKLAFQNFRRSVSTYFSLILSLAFSILVLANFSNLVYSDTFASLQGNNREYLDMLVNCICVVLLCFMFFFIWYATNVFLERRKKEIGIYVFMGLNNQRIGQMYMVETVLIGLSALVLGLGAGVLVSQLFQMILLAMSDLSVELHFRFSLKVIGYLTYWYGIMYGIFVIKGYVNIVRSSVLGLISAGRRNEYVRQNRFVLVCRAVLGVGILGTGFYLATKNGRMDVMMNLMEAVVLVIIGVYLLFGGFIPLLFQSLARCKKLLYRGERVLWVNQMAFRMRKNYRTYAMTCVLMLCSVSALAAGFAMKYRYDNMIRFRNTYTFQFVTPQAGMDEQIAELIEVDNDITYSTEAVILGLDNALIDTRIRRGTYAILPYSQMAVLAEAAGLEPLAREPGEDEIITVENSPLLSFYTDRTGYTVTINGKVYNEIDLTYVPYLGYLQEIMCFYVVNDAVYAELLPLGQEIHAYNYRIADIYNYEASLDDTNPLMELEGMGRVAIDPHDEEIDWIRALYPMCIFMFLVFILASGSILFMKLYNDAFEEKERYAILRKLGCDEKRLKRSIAKELFAAYALPSVVITVSAWFSVHALEKLMSAELFSVYVVSVSVVYLFFALFYGMSVVLYHKNAIHG